MPVVRISGVETGSDRYIELLAKYRGVLLHFQLAQQQQVMLSGQRYYQVSRTLLGARMTYQNNEGQETITLELITAGGEEKTEERKEEYWKWALIELETPFLAGGDDIDVVIAAFLTTTINKSVVWARDTYVENSSDNILRFADTPQQFVSTYDPNIKLMNPDGVIFSPILRSSLLVDLRRLIPNPVVSIDLYGLRDTSDPLAITSTALQATVRASLFGSRPVDAISVQAGFDLASSIDDATFYQWENSRIYPTRVKMGVAPSAATIPAGVDAGSDDLPSFFGYPKIGTVRLGTSTRNGGFRFVPA